MTEPRIYIPKAVAFQRSAKLVSSASRQIDNGVPLSEAHVVALLEYFEFLAPEQFTSMMGPGLCAEFSAVTEHEFPLSVLKERAPLFQLLLDHTSMFASAFLHDGEDDPRCYREWKRVRQESSASGPFNGYACLASNITMAMTLGQSPPFPDSIVQLLKHRILRRTAEILLATGYKSEEHLRQIVPAQGPDSPQLLAMQAFVLSRRGPEDLMKLCGKINGSVEATLVYWASKDPLISHLLKTWQWLEPILYDDDSKLSPEMLRERGGMLFTAWRGGLGAPAGLAQRELPESDSERANRFPCVLGAGQKQRFSPVDVLLVGGMGVGKTAFLRALGRHLDLYGGTLGKGLHLEPAEPLEFWNTSSELRELGTLASGGQPRAYHLRIRDDQDPQAARRRLGRFLARGLGQRLRRADAGHHVLALGVDQELAVDLARAGRRVAGEGDAGGRGVAQVAEHHGLHVDGGAPAVGDAVQAAVGFGAGVVPGAEYGADRAPQLLGRVLRERLAGLALDRLLVGGDDLQPVVGAEIGVEREAR